MAVSTISMAIQQQHAKVSGLHLELLPLAADAEGAPGVVARDNSRTWIM